MTIVEHVNGNELEMRTDHMYKSYCLNRLFEVSIMDRNEAHGTIRFGNTSCTDGPKTVNGTTE